MRRALLCLAVLLATLPTCMRVDTDSESDDDSDTTGSCDCSGEIPPSCRDKCKSTTSTGSASCAFVP